jgi:TRAP-type C4-dicarboxylate transport system substrate-binding protein
MTQPLKLRWILAHVPYDLFLRSANAFSKAIKEKTQGSIEVEVLGKNEWEQKYNNGVEVSNFEAMELCAAGEFEMSQVYSTLLGKLDRDFYVLDYPFLFENHDHATRVLDGEIGQGLLENLSKRSAARGLAFTYSGGYKMLAANKKIKNISDLKGMTLRCAVSPISDATFKTIGAIPAPLGIDGFTDAVANKEVDGGENVFPRYYRSKVDKVTSVIANTQHSLFLTTIIINKQLWEGVLTEEQRQIIQECAQIAAIEERKESLIDGDAALAKALGENKEVIEWSEDAIEEFKQATEPLYDQFDNFFSVKNFAKKIRLS